MLRTTIESRFQVPIWDETARQKSVDFWSRRGVKFNVSSDKILFGKRGHLWGNLVSFDMSKLMAKLTIMASEGNRLHCVLEVNTVFQQVTDYNRMWWELEMETFESFLLHDDEKPEQWQKFGANYKNAAWLWSLSLGLLGNKTPPEDKS